MSDLTPAELRRILQADGGAFARVCMMREAIASCAIEGVTVSPETEQRLLTQAAAGIDEGEEA